MNPNDLHVDVNQILNRPVSWADRGQWDSVDHLNVIMMIEKNYGVRFNSQEINKYQSVRELYDACHRKNRMKVLVVDCDNTLWNGIVGEDGIGGIEPNVELQRRLVELEANGYLICLCSRNNPEDVWDLFSSRQMPLNALHITDSEIGWGSKVEGLKALSKRLDLDLSAFTLLDDSPFERGMVQDADLGVLVYAPDDPEWQNWFTRKSSEGSLTQKYRAAIEFRSHAVDDSYLRSLEMKGRLIVNDPTTLDRCVELSNKTNQFNVCLRRYTQQMMTRRINWSYFTVICGTLVDRFGDHGIVGLAVIGENGTFTDFCISCRALGRGYEFAFFRKCAELMNRPICIEYVEGDRNQQCDEFVRLVRSRNYPTPPIEWS